MDHTPDEHDPMRRRPDSPPDPAHPHPAGEDEEELRLVDEEEEEDELHLDDEPGAAPEGLHDLDLSAPEGYVPTKALEESDVPIGNVPSSERDQSLRSARLITVSCYRSLPLLGKRQIKDALVQDVKIVTRKKPFSLLAWCVMPEHAHFFCYPRVDDPSPLEIIRLVQHRFAIRLIRRWRDIRAQVLDEITDPLGSVHLWKPAPDEDLVITKHEEIPRVIRLIETKPVRRGLVEDPTHWNWSSARRRMGEEMHGLGLEYL